MTTKLKYRKRDLFRHGKVIPKFLYKQLDDLQEQIDDLDGSSNTSNSFEVEVKELSALSASTLGSAFGAASSFKGVGIAKLESGDYLVVSDGTAFRTASLDKL